MDQPSQSLSAAAEVRLMLNSKGSAGPPQSSLDLYLSVLSELPQMSAALSVAASAAEGTIVASITKVDFVQ